MRKSVVTVLSLFALSGAGPWQQSELEKAIAADDVKIEGIYVYLDGDRFVYECGGSMCADVLARDKYLNDNVLKLDRTKVTLVVRRAVCAREELTVWCMRSSNGSYLQIKEWIEPRAK